MDEQKKKYLELKNEMNQVKSQLDNFSVVLSKLSAAKTQTEREKNSLENQLEQSAKDLVLLQGERRTIMDKWKASESMIGELRHKLKQNNSFSDSTNEFPER